MQLEIYDENATKDKLLFIRLIDDGTYIDLVTTNADGDHGYSLLSFNKKSGKLILHNNVSTELGFNLDLDGKLRTGTEC